MHGQNLASILRETAKGKAEFGMVRNHSDWFGLVPNFLFKKEFDREWKIQLVKKRDQIKAEMLTTEAPRHRVLTAKEAKYAKGTQREF